MLGTLIKPSDYTWKMALEGKAENDCQQNLEVVQEPEVARIYVDVNIVGETKRGDEITRALYNDFGDTRYTGKAHILGYFVNNMKNGMLQNTLNIEPVAILVVPV
ncbi:uncharacterized protein FFB20_09154 [Fusarium fujikuroi]|nr:uncharacterized protein FFB20_09154 [Fusarium fujikuroi]SCO24110.1 uncharacterized protein FFE2_15879 [Fusarium fujikuroi]SCO25639.1 uncharacterized protein FFC1_15633 [Fusarium fujikuroi]SCO53937.1 uncharacterized protein FFNC_15265 [Fusarium fujikuroi]